MDDKIWLIIAGIALLTLSAGLFFGVVALGIIVNI